MEPKTLFDRIWERHVVAEPEGEPALLYVDLHLVHEVTSPQAFEGLRLAGRAVRRPDLTVATMDHNVPTEDDADLLRGRAAGGRLGEGPVPLRDRRGWRLRRRRPRGRVRGRADPRALDGEPDDGLQHVDRVGRARRHDRAGRDDVHVSR